VRDYEAQAGTRKARRQKEGHPEPAKQADMSLDLMRYLYRKRKPGIALETGELVYDEEVAAKLATKGKGGA